MTTSKSSHTMRTFWIIWAGQFVSTLGSGLTGFALGVYLYELTGSVTIFALNLLAYSLPGVLLAPFVGVLTDRWDRRTLLILSDAGAGVSSLIVLLLLLGDNLAIWHIYLLTAVGAAFNSFQWPAYQAATTMLVPKDQLGRAAGLSQIGEAVSQLASPAIAGALFLAIGLRGVIAIDFVTFLVAVSTLLFVRIPRPKRSAAGASGQGSIWKEAAYGWHYIRQRPGLFGLLLWAAVVNFASSFFSPVFLPMMLMLTTVTLAGVAGSVIGVGMLLGTLVMSAWGGPKRRVRGIMLLGAWLGFGVMLAGMRPNVLLIIVAAMMAMFVLPMINGTGQALWQMKVEPDVQGRVFATRRMISMSIAPIATALAGPLVDRVLGPALLEGGMLAGSVGRVIGVGPSRGAGFLFILGGALVVLASALTYLHPRVRLLETEVPDVVIAEADEGETAVSEVPAPAA